MLVSELLEFTRIDSALPGSGVDSPKVGILCWVKTTIGEVRVAIYERLEGAEVCVVEISSLLDLSQVTRKNILFTG